MSDPQCTSHSTAFQDCWKRGGVVSGSRGCALLIPWFLFAQPKTLLIYSFLKCPLTSSRRGKNVLFQPLILIFSEARIWNMNRVMLTVGLGGLSFRLLAGTIWDPEVYLQYLQCNYFHIMTGSSVLCSAASQEKRDISHIFVSFSSLYMYSKNTKNRKITDHIQGENGRYLYTNTIWILPWSPYRVNLGSRVYNIIMFLISVFKVI